MISVGFNRVSKKDVRVGFAANPLIVAFREMKVLPSARNGGNIHVHPETPFITIRPKIKNANSQLISLPPLEIRDTVFREFIRLSPSSNYMKELVTGPAGLLSRGLLEEHATNYGALPRTKRERATLAGILNDYVRARFPAYAQSHSGAGVVGVPGFWQELSGVVHIWKTAQLPDAASCNTV